MPITGSVAVAAFVGVMRAWWSNRKSPRNLHVAGPWASRCRTTVIPRPEPQSCASCKISSERYVDRTAPNSACVRRSSMMNAAIRVARRIADASTHLTAILRVWSRRITNCITTRTKALPRNGATVENCPRLGNRSNSVGSRSRACERQAGRPLVWLRLGAGRPNPRASRRNAKYEKIAGAKTFAKTSEHPSLQLTPLPDTASVFYKA